MSRHEELEKLYKQYEGLRPEELSNKLKEISVKINNYKNRTRWLSYEDGEEFINLKIIFGSFYRRLEDCGGPTTPNLSATFRYVTGLG